MNYFLRPILIGAAVPFACLILIGANLKLYFFAKKDVCVRIMIKFHAIGKYKRKQ